MTENNNALDHGQQLVQLLIGWCWNEAQLGSVLKNLIGNRCLLQSQEVPLPFRSSSIITSTMFFIYRNMRCLQQPLQLLAARFPCRRASHFQGHHHPCIQENNHLPPSRPIQTPYRQHQAPPQHLFPIMESPVLGIHCN